ncbi:MAG: DNA polymerase [Clostridia bacterium]|nr:DNA polymerase [Clostridia bacterium]
MKYTKVTLNNGKWVITEKGKDYLNPLKWVTFAFDTETLVFFKGKILSQKQLFKKVRNLNNEQKRKALSNVTWAWQVYDEVNGFFMTNDFNEFLAYQCRAGLKFGWCYNSTFDFAQIDYEILAKGKEVWKLHEHQKHGYNKGQAWTYESIHNDCGARYAYKLWCPYKNKDRHTYVHAVEYHDFMKLVTGGLGKLLEDLNITDNEGQPIRKLTMEYQAIDQNNLTDEQIDYCCNDVKGLYFAVKKFNATIEEQSNGESHIYGKYTNIMTAGGFAKRELLRSLYPNKKKQFRLMAFQKQHPITTAQDKYVRENHLYRGGISFVNPVYKGKLLTKEMMHCPMYRYDVNSEYPYSMASINDLVGTPFKKTLKEYEEMEDKDAYECIYILKSVTGHVKQNYLGLWYDPFRKDFVEDINETGIHLMYEREVMEMEKWYDDFEIEVDEVILLKKGKKIYAPFVNKNYEGKAQAKKDGNKTLQQVMKLLLNSSYGKLAERIERIKGHYELNEDTGAIHFVTDETEIDAKSSMNVFIGALITCFARCYILSKIREVCAPNIKKKFVYIDTDSIHAFASYDKADAFALGGLKLEATCDAVKYIAPKTYVDIEKVNEDGTINFEIDKHKNIEVHSKGVNLSAIMADLKRKQKGKKHGLPTLDLIDRKIAYGAKYICLVAMNVQGGKVLIPTEKYLARLELAPNEDDKIILTNYEGNMFVER